MIQVVVARSGPAARNIRLLELRAAQGGPLPAFSAGAHVDVRSPSGLVRKYSLCNDPAERDSYVIAVKREPEGRGGSVDLVDNARDGDMLEISEPRNAFELDEKAPGHLFIAGGIGIAPVMAMVRRCAATGAPFRLYYCARTPEDAAFRDELMAAPFASRVTIHPDAGDPARALDLWPLLEKPGREHLYCCGPRSMLEAVRDMTGHWPRHAVHFESFVDAASSAQPQDRAFTVVLARSGERIEVPAGMSILEAVRRRGHDVPSSCEAGTCGTCRTRLLAGVAEHRDFVLDESEQEGEIMICVSRARTPELTIDR